FRPGPLIALVLVAGLGAAGVFGYGERKNPAVLDLVNKFLPSKKAATATETKVIEQGLAKLNRGDFAGSREAVAAAAELIAAVPDDEEVKAFFVLAASELKIEYGQVGADWDQAKRIVEKMKGTRPIQNRARGAFALASNDLPKAKQFLAALGDAPNADLESTWLYAVALINGNEFGRAAQVLDNAFKRGSSIRLLLLRAAVARDRGQLPEAAEFYDRALKAAPNNARAMVELASVRLRQNDTKGAGEMLAKALDTDGHKTLDAAEEARANMLRGSLAAASHDLKGAEAAYERAVSLDPNSPRVHEAYGEFRLQGLVWMSRNDKARAQERLDVALKVPTDSLTAVEDEAVGDLALSMGHRDKARDAFARALQKDPNDPMAHAGMGKALAAQGDLAAARKQMEMALNQLETDAALQYEYGSLLRRMGQSDGALQSFRKAVKLDSKEAPCRTRLGGI